MMNKRISKRVMKMVTVLCAAMFLFGTTTTVFAAVDLVGRGTSATTATTTTSSTVTDSSSTTSNTSTATNSTANSTTTNNNTTTTNSKTPVVTNDAVVQKVGTVQTGVLEKLTPFLIGIGAAFCVLLLFFHLQMNQVRYGKSEKYYKELLDFLCACKL